ncbi:MAG: YihA family ribosome biogenesis GTP-binding protein [Gemmatimonadetes bacterium]|uniref:EngB-type G domain-containing protein n=1 Tax=marine metagenome TaxID=408172 RepID=A0A382JDA2_9ZZZZ|nr:YihA family ribosome biogenesis GTP-binding protein [Gemmatimonadota bacterium]|tara:strand:- start:169 stop:762 length:594 start_codon:yes stop_codon:yes gene_type:complete
MEIHHIEFLGSFFEVSETPDIELPQVAFVGRSNVGKSSLINRLLGRHNKKIARVSSTPGKTQSINFYKINDLFIMVDLPGWGYARVPIKLRQKWETLVKHYIQENRKLAGVVHLIDSRHGPTPIDLRLLDLLTDGGPPILITLTKTDKLNRAKQNQALAIVTEQLEVEENQVVLTSSKTGKGRTELLGAIETLVLAS